MAQLQLIFDRTLSTQKEMKDLKAMYRDALSHHQEHARILEEIKTLRDQKKKIEDSVKDDFSSEFNRLDTLKIDLDSDKMLMSDKALTDLMKGKLIEVVDKHDQKYEPIFSVKFKKA